jgi:hypothetical protein
MPGAFAREVFAALIGLAGGIQPRRDGASTVIGSERHPPVLAVVVPGDNEAAWIGPTSLLAPLRPTQTRRRVRGQWVNRRPRCRNHDIRRIRPPALERHPLSANRRRALVLRTPGCAPLPMPGPEFCPHRRRLPPSPDRTASDMRRAPPPPMACTVRVGSRAANRRGSPGSPGSAQAVPHLQRHSGGRCRTTGAPLGPLRCTPTATWNLLRTSTRRAVDSRNPHRDPVPRWSTRCADHAALRRSTDIKRLRSSRRVSAWV